MTNYCTACGAPQQGDQRFCTGCGASAQPVSQQTQHRPATGPTPARRPAGRLVAAITAAVLVVVGGSVAAWVTLGRPASTAAAATPAPEPPAPAPVPTTAGQDPFGATPTAAATPTPSFGPSGSTGVSLADAAADQPSAPQVQELVARHFSAINDLDYPAWVATVTPARAKDQTSATWVQGYRSSHDSDVAITAIDAVGPQAVTVHISFVSVQDPQDAPADLQVGRICWTQQIPVSGVGSDPRLGLPPKGTSTKTAC